MTAEMKIPEPTDPGVMNAEQLAKHIETKENKHRAEMTALRALLRVRQKGM